MRSSSTRPISSMVVNALRGNDVSPERLDLVGLEHAAPRRHLVLAARHRGDEPVVLVVRELAQVKGALRVQHARAMARRAVARVEARAALHLLGCRSVRPGIGAEKNQSGKSAKVHTEPPGLTLFLSASRLMFQ